jgi:hypothetical protein
MDFCRVYPSLFVMAAVDDVGAAPVSMCRTMSPASVDRETARPAAVGGNRTGNAVAIDSPLPTKQPEWAAEWSSGPAAAFQKSS